MDQGRWRKIEELYQSALELQPAAHAAFLVSACPDADLRGEVESLLRCEQRGDDLLDTPPAWDAALAPLEPGSQLGPYRIGAGGMGEVYRARDSKLGRGVAIKVLPPAFALDADRLVRFRREAHLLASLNHPHIASIYGLEENGGLLALVLELVDGQTLAERLRQHSSSGTPTGLPLADALTFARQLAEALEYAHERGIVHRRSEARQP